MKSRLSSHILFFILIISSVFDIISIKWGTRPPSPREVNSHGSSPAVWRSRALQKHVLFADVLTFNNGDEFFGKALSANDIEVEFTSNGKTQIYSATEVMKLEFESFRMLPGQETVSDIKDPVLLKALQNPVTENDYPQASRVDLLDEDRYDLSRDGTFSLTRHRAFVVLKEKARHDANHSFTFFPDIENFEILYGRSITPSKSGFLGFLGGSAGSVRYVSDRTIADEADFATVPMYSRRHSVKFAIPEVNAGTLVDWVYKIHRFKTDQLKPFYVEKLLQDNEPKQLARLVVSVPKGVSIKYHIDNHGIPVSVEQMAQGENTIYIFEASNTTAIFEEPSMPPLARMAPRVVCSLADTWETVAARYEKVLADIRSKALAEPILEQIRKEIIGNLEEQNEIVKAIYLYLGSKMALVPVKPVDFSHQPLDPLKVIRQRQGSILDKAFLFHLLLAKSGIQNNLVLLRSYQDGDFVSDVPNLLQCPLLGVEINSASGPLSICIPIDEYNGTSVRPDILQGAKGIRVATGEPIAIPMMPSSEEGLEIKTEAVILENGTLKMKQLFSPKGQMEAYYRRYKTLSQEEIKQSFEEDINYNFPGAELKTFEVSGVSDLSTEMSFMREFEVQGFALKSGKDLLVIPIPVGKVFYSATSVGSPNRFSDLFWETENHLIQTISLKIPAGYSLYALPQGNFEVMDKILYRSSYGFSVDKIIFNDIFKRNARELSSENYNLYKNLIEERSKTANQWIVIRKREESN